MELKRHGPGLGSATARKDGAGEAGISAGIEDAGSVMGARARGIASPGGRKMADGDGMGCRQNRRREVRARCGLGSGRNCSNDVMDSLREQSFQTCKKKNREKKKMMV